MACFRSVVSSVIRKGIGVNSSRTDCPIYYNIRNSSYCVKNLERAGCSAITQIPKNSGNTKKHRLKAPNLINATAVRHYSLHHDKWVDLAFEDFVALLDSRDIQLIDVREPKEIEETGSFPYAVNIPLGTVKGALLQMDDTQFQERFKVPKPQKHDSNIVFVGLGPIKSSAAVELAHKFGYKKARHYPGGYEEWSMKGNQ